MRFVIWRDSLSAGDDVDAPHARMMSIPADGVIGELVEKILESYLPRRVQGGKATWLVEGERPVAVVAQQWSRPRWLVPPETAAAPLRRVGGPPDFNVRACMVDPDALYEHLRAGKPLPDGTISSLDMRPLPRGVHLLWWVLAIAPPAALVAAAATRFMAHSAEAAVEASLVLLPFLLAALILSPIVYTDTRTPRLMSLPIATHLASLRLSVAVVPMYAIVGLTSAPLLWHSTRAAMLSAAGLALLNGGWLFLMVRLRRRLRRARE